MAANSTSEDQISQEKMKEPEEIKRKERELKSTIDNFKKEEAAPQSELFQKSNELTKMQQALKERDKMIMQHKHKIKELEQVVTASTSEAEGLKDEIQKLTLQLNQAHEEFKSSFDVIQEKEKCIEKLKRENYHNSSTDPIDFYDGVIKIPGLSKLNQGWEVLIKDVDRYKENCNIQGVIVSVVGNYNKGKTFLLELLSEIKSPHGFSVSTEGISIKYLGDEKYPRKSPIIALDTQGGSLPINLSEFEAAEDPEEALKELLRDHHATEDILQNFIMETATVIIIVVSDLTFDDQTFITKIKKKFQANARKNLLVVHNLLHCSYRIEVEKKIAELIKTSFNLSEKHYAFETDNNPIYFVEKKDNLVVTHLVLAKHGSEAGEYYNESTIQYLRNIICSADQSHLDVVKSFCEYLQKHFSDYIKIKDEDTAKPLEIIMKINDCNISQIVLQNCSKLGFKGICADELGLIKTLAEGPQPAYTTYIDESGLLCIKIECPGASKDRPKYKVEESTTDFRILIKGEKIFDDGQKLMVFSDERKSGKYTIMTSFINKNKYNLESKTPILFEMKDGYIIFKWKVTKIDNIADDWNEA